MDPSTRILRALTQGPMCDDCLTNQTGLAPRQSVNLNSRKLAEQGLLIRAKGFCPFCGGIKLTNRLPGGRSKTGPLGRRIAAATAAPPQPELLDTPDSHPWHWAGALQARLVDHLTRQGCRLVRVIEDPREGGYEISGQDVGGRRLLLIVVGYPEGGPVEELARQRFATAVLALTSARQEHFDAELSLGLPAGLEVFEKLVVQVDWLKTVTPFKVYWVSERGLVMEG
jgi:hypothetical protein